MLLEKINKYKITNFLCLTMKANILFLVIDSLRSDKCYGDSKTSITLTSCILDMNPPDSRLASSANASASSLISNSRLCSLNILSKQTIEGITFKLDTRPNLSGPGWIYLQKLR